jgi:hypothetical protein
MAGDDNGRDPTEQMFALVGRAITQWSFVEAKLCAIYMVCAGTVDARPRGGLEYIDSQVPTAVFYSVENFRGKLALVDAAISNRFIRWMPGAEEIAVDWTKLRDKARKLSLKRNRLAHWTVLPGHGDEDEGIIIHPRLVPPYGSPGYYEATGLHPEKLTITPHQIEHLEHAFCLLTEKLRLFCYSVRQSRSANGASNSLT